MKKTTLEHTGKYKKSLNIEKNIQLNKLMIPKQPYWYKHTKTTQTTKQRSRMYLGLLVIRRCKPLKSPKQ